MRSIVGALLATALLFGCSGQPTHDANGTSDSAAMPFFVWLDGAAISPSSARHTKLLSPLSMDKSGDVGACGDACARTDDSSNKGGNMQTLKLCGACFALLAVTSVVGAQEAPMVVARPVAAAQPANTLTLPANTPITVRMNEELSTRRNEEGDTFYMSVVGDVVHNGYVIIPAGTRAVGTITWLTGRGAFGKSGKMEISITAVEIGNARVPVVGNFRQEGEGNTVATVGAVVVAGVFGAFVTGHSGVIPAGRELQVHTRDPFTVAIAQDLPPAATVTAQPAAAMAEAAGEAAAAEAAAAMADAAASAAAEASNANSEPQPAVDAQQSTPQG